jgi:DNA (cytosine-5)-methyltransferase 1
MPFRFGSVCSGIEAASVAWHPLGWQAAWMSEIEPFPSAVLAHHYPSVPNLGDMTKLPARIASGEVEAPDVFCGGTPCQAFSVAGLRKSLDDARGNLSLIFCEIANEIDSARALRGEQPAVIFWENVPGVLSTKDNAFGCFLAGLAGEDDPLEPPGGKWTNAGCVHGPTRTVAWRILDAQYFGVAQRRRRVFVVASARDDFNPVEVLLEFDGLRRDSAPSREAGQKPAPTIRSGASNGSPSHGQWSGDSRDELIVPHVHAPEIARCIATREGSSQDWETTTMVAHSLTASRSSTQCPNEDTTLVPVGGVKYAHYSHDYAHDRITDVSGVNPSLTKEAHASGNLNVAVPVAEPYTLAIRGRGDSHNLEYRQDGLTNALLTPNGGRGGIGVGAVAQAMPINTMIATRYEALGEGTGFGIGEPGDPAYTLTKGHSHAVAQPVAYTTKLHNTASNNAGKIFEERTTALDANSPPPALLTDMQVRRLTPVECERLQGFPDGYTAIPWRNKPADQCPDGPRYKALGNSWAVPVVRWIGRRIHNAMIRHERIQEAA